MRMTLAAALLGALFALGGCLAGAPRRAMAVELETEAGRWRLEGLQAANLDLGDWQVRVSDTSISDLQKVPYLLRFTLAIVNTSKDHTLYIEPREIYLTGADRRAVWLGPPEPVVLAPAQRLTLTFDEGLRAPVLLHPFAINITVFRSPGAARPQKAVILLY